jgi:citrate lyase alpha subunit
VYNQNTQTHMQDPALEVVKNSLANLTIMSSTDNSILGSPPFADKKAEYLQSSIALTRDLANYPNWTVAEVQQRTDVLSDLAVKVFKL